MASCNNVLEAIGRAVWARVRRVAEELDRSFVPIPGGTDPVRTHVPGRPGSGPGRRPVLADRQIIDAGAIVLGVHRPDKPAALKDEIDQLKLEHTVR